MTLIRCKVGAAQTNVMGVTYNFEIDKAGRFVCDVPISRHIELLLSAGTYEAVDPLPVGTLLAREAENLEAIRAEIAAAIVPDFINIAPEGADPVIVASQPWPALVPMNIAQMLEGIPEFITIDPNDKLIVTLSNGRAEYRLKGTADGVRLYELLDGSTYEEVEWGARPATSPAAVDDLTRISGIGAATAKKLVAAGVVSFARIALWTAGDVEAMDVALKLHGAITRDKWVEQAAAFVRAIA